MKNLYVTAFAAVAFIASVSAQTVWTGPDMTYVKAPFTDTALEENQDRITSIVWLTRGNTAGIYNAHTESQYSDFSSPADTEWAFGSAADYESLSFADWETTIGSNPITNMLNNPMVLHLITDDIYIDVTFTDWSQGNGMGQPSGGGFTYIRSTDQGTSVNNLEKELALNVYPNPASDFLAVDGIQTESTYRIFDLNSRLVAEGVISANDRINIATLESGNYVIQVGKVNLRFNKK
jgi:hypothetical protein